LAENDKKKKPSPSEFIDATFSVKRKGMDKDKNSDEDKTN